MAGEWEDYRQAVYEQRREDRAAFGGNPPLRIRFIRSFLSWLAFFAFILLFVLLIVAITPDPKSNDEKLDEICEDIGAYGILDYVIDEIGENDILEYLYYLKNPKR